jgi:hypothetical protein
MARRGRAVAVRADGPDEEPAHATAKPQPKDKMSVLMSNPVRRRLRVAAAVQDRDVSEVIEEAVQQYLDNWDRERAARGLPPLTVE